MPRAQVPFRAHKPAHRARATEPSVAKLVECPTEWDLAAPIPSTHDANENHQCEDRHEIVPADAKIERDDRRDACHRVQLDARRLVEHCTTKAEQLPRGACARISGAHRCEERCKSLRRGSRAVVHTKVVVAPRAVVQREAVGTAGTAFMQRTRDARANRWHEVCTRRVLTCHIRFVAAAIFALGMPRANIEWPVWAASLKRRRQRRAAIEISGDGVQHHTLASAKGVPELIVAVVPSLFKRAHGCHHQSPQARQPSVQGKV